MSFDVFQQHGDGEELEYSADAVDPGVEVAAPSRAHGVVSNGRFERVEVDEIHQGGKTLAGDGFQE